VPKNTRSLLITTALLSWTIRTCAAQLMISTLGATLVTADRADDHHSHYIGYATTGFIVVLVTFIAAAGRFKH